MPPVYHVVLVKLKEDSTQQQIQEWRDAAAALPTAIPALQKVITGAKIPGNQFGGDWDDCIIYVIDSRDKLAEYGLHEAHQAYLKLAANIIQDRVIFDFDADNEM